MTASSPASRSSASPVDGENSGGGLKTPMSFAAPLNRDPEAEVAELAREPDRRRRFSRAADAQIADAHDRTRQTPDFHPAPTVAQVADADPDAVSHRKRRDGRPLNGAGKALPRPNFSSPERAAHRLDRLIPAQK